VRDCRQNELSGLQAGKRNEHDSAAKLMHDGSLVGERQSKPSLACTRRPGKRQQAHASIEQGALASDQVQFTTDQAVMGGAGTVVCVCTPCTTVDYAARRRRGLAISSSPELTRNSPMNNTITATIGVSHHHHKPRNKALKVIAQ